MKKTLLTLILFVSTLLIVKYSFATRIDGFTNNNTLNGGDEFVLWDAANSAVRNINWDDLEYMSRVGDSTNGMWFDVDNDGTDETQWSGKSYEFETDVTTEAELQAALDDCDTNGCTIRILGGVSPIEITTGLTIGDNTALVCDGGVNDHFKLANGAGVHMITDKSGGATNFSIDGCSFDGNQANTSNQRSAIRVTNGSSKFRVTNSKFHDQRVGGISINKGEHFLLDNLEMWNQGYTGLTGGAAIQCHGGDDDYVEANYCRYGNMNNIFVHDSEGHGLHIKWLGAHHINVNNYTCLQADEDCILLGAQNPLNRTRYLNLSNLHIVGGDIMGLDVIYGEDINVSNAFITGTGTYAVQIFGTKNSHFSGIKVQDITSGGGFVVNAGTLNSTIVNSSVVNTTGNCFSIERGSSFNTISDNICVESSSTAFQTRLDAHYNTFSNNMAIDLNGGKSFATPFDDNEGSNFWFDNKYYDEGGYDADFKTEYGNGMYRALRPNDLAFIQGDSSTFTGQSGDTIKVTIDGTDYDDIDISSCIDVNCVRSAIFTDIPGTDDNVAFIDQNGNLALISGTCGGSVAIDDGTSTTQTVVGELFSVSGDRSDTSDCTGFIETNIKQKHRNDIEIINSGNDNIDDNKYFIGLQKLGLQITGAMANGSTLTTTGYIDDTPAGEWTGPDADFAASTDTTYYKEGTASLKIAETASASIGDKVTNPLSGGNQDWSGRESVGFWFRTNKQIFSAHVRFVITDSSAGDTEIVLSESANLDTWVWKELNISGVADASKDDITDISIKVQAVYSGLNMWFDFMASWDASAETALDNNPVEDGVYSVSAIPVASGTNFSGTTQTEYTDYFINYGSSTSHIVPITDESANAFAIIYSHE